MDDDIEPIPSLCCIRPRPDQKQKVYSFDDQLTDALHDTVPVPSCDDAAFGKHVNDGRHKQPPVTTLVGVVKQAVLDPMFLVLKKCGSISLGFLVFTRK